MGLVHWEGDGAGSGADVDESMGAGGPMEGRLLRMVWEEFYNERLVLGCRGGDGEVVGDTEVIVINSCLV